MKHIKKFFLLTLLFCNLSFTLFANRTERKLEETSAIDFSENFWLSISKKSLPERDIEEAWYKERIPAKYADAFLYYTKNKPEIRMNFYSLMVHESSNFTAYVHKNKDGSYDYGPSQLNSKNLKNKTFQKYYRPKDESHITNKYCFYMVETINFYWDLYNKVGEKYAFYAYNGGERAAMWKKEGKNTNSSLIQNVTNYDKCIRLKIEEHTKELASYKEEARNEHIAQLKREVTEKGLFAALDIYNDYDLIFTRLSYIINEDLSRKQNCETTLKIYERHIIAYIKREDYYTSLYEFS